MNISETDRMLIRLKYPNCPEPVANEIACYAAGLTPALEALAIQARKLNIRTPEELRSMVGFEYNPDPDRARGNAAFIALYFAHVK
jgi:hypothetical protein